MSADIAAGLASGAVLGLSALVAALVPGRLMQEATHGDWTWRDGWRLAATAFGVGLLVLAGLKPTLPRIDGPTTGALAVCGVLLTAILVLDIKALVVADLHVVALLILALVGPLAQPWMTALVGAIVGGGLLWAVRWLFRRVRGVEGLGLGDVKLMTALGALVGPERVLWIIVAGAVLGLAWGVLSRGRNRGDGPISVPLAATCALPALAVLLLGVLRP